LTRAIGYGIILQLLFKIVIGQEHSKKHSNHVKKNRVRSKKMGRKIANGMMWMFGIMIVVVGILIACPLGEAIRTIGFLAIVGVIFIVISCKK